ncbi:MAG: phage Mendokysei [Actinomycetota bacterium]|jgi:hypothetical protein
MGDLASAGSTVGGYRKFGTSSGGSGYTPISKLTRDTPAPSLFEQFGDVLRGLPGGLAEFAGKAAQTVASPFHLAWDAAQGDVDVDSFGDFTNEYLPFGDMVARSLGNSVMRLRHPSRYLRAIERGEIVGVVLEDLGNAAIVAGGLGKALGSAGSAGAAGAAARAAEAGAAAGTIGEAATQAVARGAQAGARGSGVARLLNEGGYLEAAQAAERAGTMLKHGSRVVDTVASQPFPAIRWASGKLGDAAAPLVERAVTERLGRPFEIARTGSRPLRLSEVAANGLVGTRVGRSALFSRLTPEGQALADVAQRPLEDQLLKAQMDVAQPGTIVEEVSKETGRRLSREDPEYINLSKATVAKTIGDLDQQVAGWAREYEAAATPAEQAAVMDRVAGQLSTLFEGASDSSQIVTPDVAKILIDDALGRLPAADAEFINRVSPAMREMYDILPEMGRQGVGGRPITAAEMGSEPLPVEQQRQRRRLEGRREVLQRQEMRAFKDMNRTQVQARISSLLADEIPAPPRLSTIMERGKSVQRAVEVERRARNMLVRARQNLRRLYADYDAELQRGGANVDEKLAAVEKQAQRVEELKAREAELRRTQQSRVSRAKVARAPRTEPPPPDVPPSSGPSSPDTPEPPSGGGGAAPAAAPRPEPEVVPQPEPEVAPQPAGSELRRSSTPTEPKRTTKLSRVAERAPEKPAEAATAAPDTPRTRPARARVEFERAKKAADEAEANASKLDAEYTRLDKERKELRDQGVKTLERGTAEEFSTALREAAKDEQLSPSDAKKLTAIADELDRQAEGERKWEAPTEKVLTQRAEATIKAHIGSARSLPVNLVDGELWYTDTYLMAPLPPRLVGKITEPGTYLPDSEKVSGSFKDETKWRATGNEAPDFMKLLTAPLEAIKKGAYRRAEPIGRSLIGEDQTNAILLSDGTNTIGVQLDKLNTVAGPGTELFIGDSPTKPVLVMRNGKPVGLVMGVRGELAPGSFDAEALAKRVGDMVKKSRAYARPGSALDRLLELGKGKVKPEVEQRIAGISKRMAELDPDRESKGWVREPSKTGLIAEARAAGGRGKFDSPYDSAQRAFRDAQDAAVKDIFENPGAEFGDLANHYTDYNARVGSQNLDRATNEYLSFRDRLAAVKKADTVRSIIERFRDVDGLSRKTKRAEVMGILETYLGNLKNDMDRAAERATARNGRPAVIPSDYLYNVVNRRIDLSMFPSDMKQRLIAQAQSAIDIIEGKAEGVAAAATPVAPQRKVPRMVTPPDGVMARPSTQTRIPRKIAEVAKPAEVTRRADETINDYLSQQLTFKSDEAINGDRVVFNDNLGGVGLDNKNLSAKHRAALEAAAELAETWKSGKVIDRVDPSTLQVGEVVRSNSIDVTGTVVWVNDAGYAAMIAPDGKVWGISANERVELLRQTPFPHAERLKAERQRRATEAPKPQVSDYTVELRQLSAKSKPQLLQRLGVDIPKAWRKRKGAQRGMNAEDVFDGLVPERGKAFDRTGREMNRKPLRSVEEVAKEAGDDAIVVISCGNSKLGTAAAAADLYTSDYFKKNLEAARAITGGDDSRIRILSAKHGYLPLDEVIEPYEVSFKFSDEGVIDVNTLRRQARGLPDKPVVVLGGKEYTGAVVTTIGDRHVVAPFVGSEGIGAQKKIAGEIAGSARRAESLKLSKQAPKPTVTVTAPKVPTGDSVKVTVSGDGLRAYDQLMNQRPSTKPAIPYLDVVDGAAYVDPRDVPKVVEAINDRRAELLAKVMARNGAGAEGAMRMVNGLDDIAAQLEEGTPQDWSKAAEPASPATPKLAAAAKPRPAAPRNVVEPKSKLAKSYTRSIKEARVDADGSVHMSFPGESGAAEYRALDDQAKKAWEAAGRDVERLVSDGVVDAIDGSEVRLGDVILNENTGRIYVVAEGSPHPEYEYKLPGDEDAVLHLSPPPPGVPLERVGYRFGHSHPTGGGSVRAYADETVYRMGRMPGFENLAFDTLPPVDTPGHVLTYRMSEMSSNALMKELAAEKIRPLKEWDAVARWRWDNLEDAEKMRAGGAVGEVASMEQLRPGNVVEWDGERAMVAKVTVDDASLTSNPRAYIELLFDADGRSRKISLPSDAELVRFARDLTDPAGRPLDGGGQPAPVSAVAAPEPEPAPAAAGGGAQPPAEPPVPPASGAGGAGAGGGDMNVGRERAKLPTARGRRLEAERTLGEAERRATSAQVKLARKAAGPEPVTITKARDAVSTALDNVERTGRNLEAVKTFGELTPEERTASRQWRRSYTKDGVLKTRSAVERINRQVGAAEERASVAARRHAQLVDQIERINRDIADVPHLLSRPAQAEIRDAVHGTSQSLPAAKRLPEAKVVKERGWIELEDGRWGRVVGPNMVEVIGPNGKPVLGPDRMPILKADGWNVRMSGGKVESVPFEGKWRYVGERSGAVGTLQRQLRRLRDPFGFLANREESLNVSKEELADLAASGMPTTRKVTVGKGVVWDTVRTAVNRTFGEDAVDTLIEVGDDLANAASDRERYSYLEANADRLGLNDGELRALEESMRVDEKLATMDAVVTQRHNDGAWMDLPHELGRLTEDLEFAPQEWQNARNRVRFNFDDRRARSLADDALNVEAMPPRWRAPAQFARRQVRWYLDEARRLANDGDHLAASEQLKIAAEVATNIRDLAEMGVDPIYVAGGIPAKSIGTVETVSKSPLPDEKMRRTPFKPLTVEGAQRTQLDRMVRRLRNETYDRVEQTFGKTVSQVPGLDGWLRDFIAENDRYPARDEFVDTARQMGWVPLNRAKGLGATKAVDNAGRLLEDLQQAEKNYDDAIRSGDDARIQRARLELDAADTAHQRSVNATPKVLREAWGRYETARVKLAKMLDQDPEGGSLEGRYSTDPDVLAAAQKEFDQRAAELAAAEEAALPKLVPDTIAREMMRDASLWDRGTLPGFRLLTRANRAYKTQVLPLSARWYINNTIGNVIMAGVFGGVGPVELFRQIKRLRSEVGFKGAGRKSQSMLEADLLGGALDVGGVRGGRIVQSGLFENQRRGLGLAEFDTPDARTRPGRALRKVTDYGYGVNEFFDNVSRSAVYLSKLERNVKEMVRRGLVDETNPSASVEAAAKAALRDTLRAMGDYTNMAPWQRKYLRQVFPWWSWIRHSTVAAMRLPIEHPMRAAWLAQLSVLANEEGLTGAELAFFSGKWMLGDGSSVNLGSLSPLENPLENPILNPTSLLRSMSPALKVGIAGLTGIDMGRLQQVTKPPKDRARGAFGQQVAEPLAYDPAGLLGYAFGQLPMARNLRDFIDGPSIRYGTGEPIKDRSGRPIPNGKTRAGALAAMFGVPFPETMTEAERKRREKQRERLSQ